MPRALLSPVKTLLDRVRADFPRLTFAPGATDRWDACGTIFYTPATSDASLLHELAHALLGHSTYSLDIDLIKMERAAWDHARRDLAPRYGVTITVDDAEDALDTYRDWLHNRSLCPDCHLSGLQLSGDNAVSRYRCLACGQIWRANAAKTCALRRFKQHRN